MNSDSTKDLPNEGDKYDTKPGITAVLERINALDEKWEKRFSNLEAGLVQLDEKWEKRFSNLEAGLVQLDEKLENRFAAFETKQEARHQEVLGQLRKLNQQFELVAIDITKARAELRDHRRRIEQLEEQQPVIK
jgi:chromosome segregation ATPase